MDIDKQKIQALQDVLDVQCSSGNWDHDPYMHGMANGLILAQSIIADKDPEYLDAPKVWGETRYNIHRMMSEFILVATTLLNIGIRQVVWHVTRLRIDGINVIINREQAMVNKG